MTFPLTDSHCHLPMLDLSRHGGTLDGALAAARAAGVGHMLCVSVDLESYPAVLDSAERNPGVFASVGVHPNAVASALELTAERLAEQAAHPRVVAIGETGLDYYRDDTVPELQQSAFRAHIAASRRSRKPLIIHMRSATKDTLRILREERADDVGGVLHCFTEDWGAASAALDLGFYVSFSGIVTFKNAVTLQDVARRLPIERMLIETDSPYLAPVPLRGRPNEPAYVGHVAAFIAGLRDLDASEIAKHTTENFFTLFNAASRELDV